jgi:hypothetical protein
MVTKRKGCGKGTRRIKGGGICGSKVAIEGQCVEPTKGETIYSYLDKLNTIRKDLGRNIRRLIRIKNDHKRNYDKLLRELKDNVKKYSNSPSLIQGSAKLVIKQKKMVIGHLTTIKALNRIYIQLKDEIKRIEAAYPTIRSRKETPFTTGSDTTSTFTRDIDALVESGPTIVAGQANTRIKGFKIPTNANIKLNVNALGPAIDVDKFIANSNRELNSLESSVLGIEREFNNAADAFTRAANRVNAGVGINAALAATASLAPTAAEEAETDRMIAQMRSAAALETPSSQSEILQRRLNALTSSKPGSGSAEGGTRRLKRRRS